jgi:hypothetical protein
MVLAPIQATREAEAAARIEAANASHSNTLPRGSSKPNGAAWKNVKPAADPEA